MAEITRTQVEEVLRAHRDPCLDEDYMSLDAVREIAIDGSRVRVDLRLGYPCGGVAGGIAQILKTGIENLADGVEAEVAIGFQVVAHRAQKNMRSMENVKNVIAVASGKGGVGKSTTAVNLALALAAEGARTGILDADIYGPSQSIMLGIPEGTRPETRDEKFFLPVEAHGLQTMSMGFLVDDRTPMVWRGPMVSSALQQLIMQTLWEDLDYLVVDMPPGTGDIQLTLSQKVPVAGAVIVTTPQDIALLDARKGIEMFRKVEIPVLGIVENMAVHVCSECGHVEHLFGEGGGTRIAEQYDTELLASLPLSMMIREQADGGVPTVIAEPDCQISMVYREMARRTAAILSRRARNYANVFPEIVVADD